LKRVKSTREHDEQEIEEGVADSNDSQVQDYKQDDEVKVAKAVSSSTFTWI
jgi:hypothetical protein